jgi:pantoate--beta-alanine ligase
MYPSGRPLTTVHVAGLTEGLCGAARPTHFDGVATVVAKLLAITGPCSAFFGRKDAQQLAVIERLVEDLNLPVTVVGCSIVREPDGLALSSRNAYLSTEGRAAARVLSRALGVAVTAMIAGERDPAALVDLVRGLVSAEPAVALEYVEVRAKPELTLVDLLDGDLLLALAARVGETRLIDNISISVRGAEVRADLGTRLQPAEATHESGQESGSKQ